MNAILLRTRQAEQACLETDVNGETVLCDPSGALVVPGRRLVVVSDLHLEKGAAFARRGMMLPPYDTLATLALLKRVIERHEPRTVLSLGDAFHDRHGAGAMPEAFAQSLKLLMAGRDWVWIAGNHDPDPPAGLGGEASAEARVGALVFRHEPALRPAPGEIAGHLHPVARVAGEGRSVRAPCFASDGARLVMPSFGVTTGGLNVLDRAFDGLFDASRAVAFTIGRARIFPIRFSALCRG